MVFGRLNAVLWGAGLLLVATASLAAGPAKGAAAQKPKKERLVLMPLRVGVDEAPLQSAMETALVEGLSGEYEVFAGERVRQKAREVFNKESAKAKKDCDETRCMQDIAAAFQAELIATASVTRQANNYFLVLNVQNIFDEKIVLSRSEPCPQCDAIQVIGKLKVLAGGKSPVVVANVQPETRTVPETRQVPETRSTPSSGSADMDMQTFVQAQKQDTIDAYRKYLEAYPQGKMAAVAGLKIKRLQETAKEAAATARSEFREPEMVRIPGKGIEMGKYEITRREWLSLMGSLPAEAVPCSEDCPVNGISWQDAQEFLEKLNARTGKDYRLPTGEEWVNACRAGKQTKYCGGDNIADLGWFKDNSGDAPHPVGQKKPNGYGLYDMTGNVWEWVDSIESGGETHRVLRSGSWVNDRYAALAVATISLDRKYRGKVYGLRIARSLP